MFLSVITPASKGIEHMSNLLNDFKNQTFKDFEHIIIWDGEPPLNIINLIKERRCPQTVFCSIPKDPGNMSIAPGTKPRNYGVSIAKGEFVCFCDDDDRYKDSYAESLITGLQDNMISVVQMSCSEARMMKNGDPTRIKLIPEIGLPYFPIICHVGTPCFAVKRQWALDDPWREEPEHDYRFIKRICEKYKPKILISGGMQVDVDGLVIGQMRDWVSIPPFYRQ